MSAAQPEYILVRYEKMRHVSMQIRDVHAGTCHEHGVLELGLVLAGQVELRLKDETVCVPEGGLFLVNPYEPHSLRGSSARVLCAWLSHNFGREYFAGVANTVFEQHTITEPEQAEHLRQLLLNAADSYFREDRLECVGTVSHLVAALLRTLPHRLNTDAQKMVRKKRAGRMQRIAAYLDQHYKEKISLAQLAEAEGLTTAYMSRVFTELFGMSFQEYLNFLRLEQALPLVRDPSVYLMDVCMECGFSDTRYLNAVFRKVFGCSAADYRRKSTQQDAAASLRELQEKRARFLAPR